MKAFDKKYLNKKMKYLAGVDEAGRGPLAGPVVAAAVIFDKKTNIKGVNDSKQLTEKQREILFDQIITKSLAYSVSTVNHNVIDELNILNATLLAMKNAVDDLKFKPDLILVDGGKGQLSSACEALKELNIYARIPIAGIAKRLEEIYFPEDSIPLLIRSGRGRQAQNTVSAGPGHRL